MSGGPETDGTPEAGEIRGEPRSGKLSFRAFRNGTPLGSHNVEFHREGDRLTVDIAIDYAVKLAFVTVFAYKLRAREIWSGDRLALARARTDNNGQREHMSAEFVEGALWVEGSKARRYRAAPGALLATHWNRRQLDAPMINPQDGSGLKFDVSERGVEKIKDSTGRIFPARAYRLSGQTPLELWYDLDDVWAGLRAKVADGSIVSYLRSA